MDFPQLENLWIQAGGNPVLAPIMAAIAMAESSGNPTNYNGNDPYGGSFGLWQINGANTMAYGGAWNEGELYNPLYNAEAAVGILKSQGLGAWSTWKSYVANDGQHGDQVISSLLGGGARGTGPQSGNATGSAPGASTGGGTVQISPQLLGLIAIGAVIAALVGIIL